MNRKGSLLQRFIAAPYMLWAALFILIPLIMVAWYSFTDGNGAFTLDNIKRLAEQNYVAIFSRSIVYSLIATVICLLIAFPLSYFISQAKPRFQSTAIMLLMLPMWTNLLIRTYSLSRLIENTGVINNLLSGILNEPIQMINTPFAVILGMIYNFLPYMVLPIYTVISKLDRSVIEASQDLGCNRMNVVTRIILPLSKGGIVSGITMVFVPAISTFYISQALGGGKNMLIGEAIESQFISAGNKNFGSALSLVLMILIMISIAIMNRFSDDEDGGGIIV